MVGRSLGRGGGGQRFGAKQQQTRTFSVRSTQYAERDERWLAPPRLYHQLPRDPRAHPAPPPADNFFGGNMHKGKTIGPSHGERLGEGATAILLVGKTGPRPWAAREFRECRHSQPLQVPSSRLQPQRFSRVGRRGNPDTQIQTPSAPTNACNAISLACIKLPAQPRHARRLYTPAHSSG